MNEMYTLGLSIHSFGTALLLAVFVLNIFLLLKASSLQKYKRLNSIILLPLTTSILGSAFFTGIIMMAAKHLDFTVENIVMIFISLILLFLEVKRHKTLKYISTKQENSLQIFRLFGLKILYIELGLSFSMALWMWLV